MKVKDLIMYLQQYDPEEVIYDCPWIDVVPRTKPVFYRNYSAYAPGLGKQGPIKPILMVNDA